MDRWIHSGDAKRVIAIRPAEGSRWRNADFRAWNAWKLNYVLEFERHPLTPIVEHTGFEEEEVELIQFEALDP